MEKAESIEDALKVQDELNKVLEKIEILQGRLSLLSQTSAFLLITVNLKVAPVSMEVDAGPDLIVRESDLTKFQARLFPPQNITDFAYSWKFGDGSSPLSGDRSIAEVGSDAVVTSTVGHAYKNAYDSPFIASIEVLGTGDAGVAEGRDSIVVTVLQIPSVDVFAGEDLEVLEDQKVSFNGSFTRHKGLTDPRFQWDFGDGSEPFEGSITSDVTAVNATHQYNNHRPRPYVATLKVTASSDAGIVEASDTVTVMVSERGDWIVAWHISDIVRTAVFGITAIGLALFAILVWLGIFSPVWLTVLAIWYFLARRTRARFQRDGPFNPVPEPSLPSRPCPSCGTRMEPMVNFCTNCGSAMDSISD